MTLQPYGITTFCDDFRQEANGKFIIIGGYSGIMTINSEAPATLPNFAIVFNVNIPLDFKFDKVKLEAVFESDEEEIKLLELELEHDEKNTNKELSSRLIDTERKMLKIFHPAIVSPFNIAQDCLISTRIYLDDKMFRTGSLEVKFEKPTDQKTP